MISCTCVNFAASSEAGRRSYRPGDGDFLYFFRLCATRSGVSLPPKIAFTSKTRDKESEPKSCQPALCWHFGSMIVDRQWHLDRATVYCTVLVVELFLCPHFHVVSSCVAFLGTQSGSIFIHSRCQTVGAGIHSPENIIRQPNSLCARKKISHVSKYHRQVSPSFATIIGVERWCQGTYSCNRRVCVGCVSTCTGTSTVPTVLVL